MKTHGDCGPVRRSARGEPAGKLSATLKDVTAGAKDAQLQVGAVEVSELLQRRCHLPPLDSEREREVIYTYIQIYTHIYNT